MKFKAKDKERGELAIMDLSEKAQDFFYNTFPLNVYGYYENGNLVYAVTGAFGEKENMTKTELDEWLCELAG